MTKGATTGTDADREMYQALDATTRNLARQHFGTAETNSDAGAIADAACGHVIWVYANRNSDAPNIAFKETVSCLKAVGKHCRASTADEVSAGELQERLMAAAFAFVKGRYDEIVRLAEQGLSEAAA